SRSYSLSLHDALPISAIRNLLRVVDGLGFYLLGALIASCSKFRRRLGDICAGTYVVEGNLSELIRALSVLAWFALLSAGVWALRSEEHTSELQSQSNL